MTAAEQLRRLRRFVGMQLKGLRASRTVAQRENHGNSFIVLGFAIAAVEAVQEELSRLARPTREKKK